MPDRSDPRALALDVLVAVETTRAYANLALPRLLDSSRMSARDKAFATELVYGTLRAQGSLDDLLAPYLSRPLDGLDSDVRGALRLGAYQLWRTRVPRHAAVGQTVGLIPPRARGFLNAVLRRVADAVDGPDPLRLSEVADPLDRLGLEYAHPRWIVDAYLDALGPAGDELELALAADDTRPTVHLAAMPSRLTADELAVEASGTTGALSPYAVYLDGGGDPGRIASVRRGFARVQDEGSQLCALAIHRALDPAGVAAGASDAEDTLQRAAGAPGPGPIVDIAAGPGGKAALLAALEQGRRPLLASELRPHRARLVRHAGVSAVVVADGRQPPFRSGSAEAVLLDAPCTGLGALRRRPEARWRKSPDDLTELVALQRALLASAWDLVRPGGLLAYVVCSPHLAEAVIEPPSGADILDVPGLLGLGADARAPDLDGLRLQLWPHRHGTDAMSMTLLRRRPETSVR
jgi:16S rRNA (cytosine967-C5)-methyltransferase